MRQRFFRLLAPLLLLLPLAAAAAPEAPVAGVDYVEIDYRERIGRSKVNLFRDSIRTLQYVLEACTYYNPLKIFVLLAMMCTALAVVSLIGGIALQLVSSFFLGVGAILLSILVVAMGLLAVLLKQIMNQRP